MANMSYCRFQNTLMDLLDCYDNLFNDLESEEEIRARERLVRVCRDILDEADGEFDE